jgi:hypothetical protein
MPSSHLEQRPGEIENQDTNRLQSSILLALKPGGTGLTVVGDDAQSIYAFRAATVRNILDFPNQFSPPAAIITLDRNYRSTQPILGVSFSPAISTKALTAIRQTVRSWSMHRRSDKTLDDLAGMFNSHIRGWINYYGPIPHGTYRRGGPLPGTGDRGSPVG